MKNKKFTKEDAFKIAEEKGYNQALKDVEKMIDEKKKGLLFIKMPLFTPEQFSWIVKRFDELKQSLKELGEK